MHAHDILYRRYFVLFSPPLSPPGSASGGSLSAEGGLSFLACSRLGSVGDVSRIGDQNQAIGHAPSWDVLAPSSGVVPQWAKTVASRRAGPSSIVHCCTTPCSYHRFGDIMLLSLRVLVVVVRSGVSC